MSNVEAAITARNLTKIYRGKGSTVALNSISLTVPRGGMFALLGPNGAGKSTFINILAGLTSKTSGTVQVWGFNLDDNPRQVRASVGVVPQELSIDPFFTPFESLEMQAGLYGVPPGQRKTLQLLQAVDLEDKRDAYTRTLSGGMRRRLLVAKSMVHDPPIVILDEPTAGVDVELRHHIWSYVRLLNARGVTVVLTTHYLEEAEELCDRIAIIDKGQVVACEDQAQLFARIDSKTVHIAPITPVDALPNALQNANTKLLSNGMVEVVYNPTRATLQEIIGRFNAAGIKIRDIETKGSRLEQVFMKLTATHHA